MELHDSEFRKILWDEESRIIGIDWKESTVRMKDSDFKADLTLFPSHFGGRQARQILVDASHFRHAIGPGIQEWRVKNISGHDFAAGAKRFAFLLPKNSQIPQMMNQSAAGESFCHASLHPSEGGRGLVNVMKTSSLRQTSHSKSPPSADRRSPHETRAALWRASIEAVTPDKS